MSATLNLEISGLTLWTNFCGMDDEYHVIKNKWLYYNRQLPTVFPRINKTFNMIDHLAKSIYNNFYNIYGLSRYHNKVSNTIKGKNILEMKNKIFDFASYIGVLKYAYLQRSSSLEMPFITAYTPRSPERTVGNEAMYLAGDKIIEDCLSRVYPQKYRWDGYITFQPPNFFGLYYAGLSQIPNLKLFHLTISEELKHSIKGLFTILHEISHLYTCELNKRIYLKAKSIDFRIKNARKNRPYNDVKELEWQKEDSGIENSGIHQNFEIKTEISKDFYELYLEAITDLIAFKIGGINHVFFYLDYLFNNPFIFNKCIFHVPGEKPKNAYSIDNNPVIINMIVRLSSIIGYLEVTAQYHQDRFYLEKRFDDLFEAGLESLARLSSEDKIKGNDELNLYRKLGTRWGVEFGVAETVWTEENRKSIYNNIIKTTFNVTPEKESDIIKSLISGNVVTNATPLEILHCYYQIYKMRFYDQEINPPNFATTLSSIINR